MTARPTQESTAEYISVLRVLASNCGFGDMTDGMIRDMVVEKTIHTRLRKKLLQDPELTLEKTLTVVDAFKRALHEAVAMSGQPTAPVVAKLTHPHPRRQQKKRPQKTLAQSARLDCGRSSHTTGSKDCPVHGRVCSPYGRLGHFAAVCRSSAPGSVSAPTAAAPRDVVKEASILPARVGSSKQKVLCPVTLSVGDTQRSIDIQVDTGLTCSLLTVQ